ncbi:CPBP family intramembrane glutamic endopeptidase [Halorussus halobius]|uniref:CPBP family intramembrane glutamic endopeptidase n=1 Tax=Halorussus halobius TaxID=1710537 RepID=UPI0010922E08|nr:type II CAAX endopeptidase family protein [Halorussus halobius]
MDDRSSSAGVGVALAGLALVAAALPWDAPAAGPVENVPLAALAGVAFVAFSLRRHGVLARGPGSVVAGLASVGAVGLLGLSAAGALAGGATVPSWWAVAFGLAGGVGGAIAAYGDLRGFPASLGPAVKAASWGLAVGYLGLFAIAAWTSLLLGAVSGVAGGEPGTALQQVVSSVALGLGTGTVALAYFRWTGKSRSFLDVEWPSRRDAGYAVGGTVALVGFQFGVSALFARLGVATADHSVQQSAANGNPTFLLLLVPAAFLLVGPGEELLYRNVVQKDLYDAFGEWGAVAVGSAVFALAHIPAYAAGASLSGLATTLVVILGLSVVLGATYLQTGNLTVPILVHGAYDAITFLVLYLQVTGGA